MPDDSDIERRLVLEGKARRLLVGQLPTAEASAVRDARLPTGQEKAQITRLRKQLEREQRDQ